MTNAQSTASKLRWLLLILALFCWALGAFWLINIAWPNWEVFPDSVKAGAGLFGVMGLDVHEGPYWAVVAAYMGLFLLTQWLFLASRGSWRVELNKEGRPLKQSVIAAALMAALLSMGIVASVMELAGVWGSFVSNDNDTHPRYWAPLLVLVVMWALWAGVFFAYWRQGDRFTQLGRMIRGLIAGSILETLVAAPVHVLVLSRSTGNEKECYCVRGSYTGLVFGGTVLLWAFGPGIVLLFMREKNRREKLLKSGPTDRNSVS